MLVLPTPTPKVSTNPQ